MNLLRRTIGAVAIALLLSGCAPWQVVWTAWHAAGGDSTGAAHAIAVMECESPTGRDSSSGAYHGWFQFAIVHADLLQQANNRYDVSGHDLMHNAWHATFGAKALADGQGRTFSRAWPHCGRGRNY